MSRGMLSVRSNTCKILHLCARHNRGEQCEDNVRIDALNVGQLNSIFWTPQVRWFKPGRSRWILQGGKNPQHAFLRMGSKAVCPMSHICGR